MKSFIPISISSLVLIALFFGLSAVYQSCGGKKDSDPLSTEEKTIQVADAYSDQDDLFFEDDDEDVSNSTSAENEDTGEENTAPEQDEANSSNSPVSNTTSVGNSTAGSAQGRFMVIAGNYLLESNADAMVSKLRDQGFGNARKAVFDLSQYYTVVAGRFNARNDANRLVSDLKSKGIDAYTMTSQ